MHVDVRRRRRVEGFGSGSRWARSGQSLGTRLGWDDSSQDRLGRLEIDNKDGTSMHSGSAEPAHTVNFRRDGIIVIRPRDHQCMTEDNLRQSPSITTIFLLKLTNQLRRADARISSSRHGWTCVISWKSNHLPSVRSIQASPGQDLERPLGLRLGKEAMLHRHPPYVDATRGGPRQALCISPIRL